MAINIDVIQSYGFHVGGSIHFAQVLQSNHRSIPNSRRCVLDSSIVRLRTSLNVTVTSAI